MAEKITLKDVVGINKILATKGYNSIKELQTYLEVIGEYIDDTFFSQDIIVERLVHYCEESYRFIDITVDKPLKDLTKKNMHDYMSNCKRALEKALYSDPEMFNFSIFVEIKSIVRYFLEKSYKYDSLTNYQSMYGINSIEFHQQNETFKYLYTVFDKFTYIARHLNEKYLKHKKVDVSELSLKFFTDFTKDISFLTKDVAHFQKLCDVIENITYSKAWHYIRKLRNTLEHDFTDPIEKYNITFSIELLFIIIGRIMLALSSTLKNELEIREELERLEKRR
ncbi:hypothetical protein SHELI_v1c02400 [Spiroplasma helicoides]|uniref:Uncharacterized protein n=1 Tax=Spiroplasma helicoides TaxID=216938 RepID=A0A1B3SJT8_9MOLU|nr:hypothetical protein [Spiroplasma helicoides]AOG60195.1 hypothetical protein SHELI_v1c02400 [Spiroplasma helicoides]